jgi:tetratricopeptide (TPR) repeat protein
LKTIKIIEFERLKLMDFLKERLRELINEKNYKEAIEVLEKVERTEEVDFISGEIYETIGYQNNDSEMFEKALDIYGGLIKDVKYGKPSIIRMSYIYEYGLGDMENSLAVLDKHLNKDDMEYLLRLTEIQYKNGEYSQIVFELNRYSANDLHPKLIYRLGKSHRKLRDSSKAMSYFKYLISNYRNHPYSLTAWGYLFMDKEKYEDAVLYFKEAMDKDFYNVVIHYNYIKCLYSLNRLEDIRYHLIRLMDKGMYSVILNEYIELVELDGLSDKIDPEKSKAPVYYRDLEGEYIDY